MLGLEQFGCESRILLTARCALATQAVGLLLYAGVLALQYLVLGLECLQLLNSILVLLFLQYPRVIDGLFSLEFIQLSVKSIAVFLE